tara:strand:+ start:1394 stop:2464 length:1071 start_codon:yes stop_codon:yes gene_type:complete
MTRVSFAAGDIGGARAILPIARLAVGQGLTVRALRHGPLAAETAADWAWFEACEARHPTFWDPARDVLFYATSVTDMAAPLIARDAQAAGVPIVHVLDNWSTYARRLELPDGTRVIPDAYCVMDALAAQRAIEDGVPADILHVTGHPGLAQLADEAAQSRAAQPGAPVQILFVSEPVARDSMAVRPRGYDEAQVSALFAQALSAQALSGQRAVVPHVHICPHPREDRAEVAQRWQALADAHGLQTSIVPPQAVRERLHGAHLVVGMTSILLYEAWLLGKPVLSLQPNLLDDALSELKSRQGLYFCTQADTLPGMLKGALRQSVEETPTIKDDQVLHREAPMRTLDLGLCLKNRGRI